MSEHRRNGSDFQMQRRLVTHLWKNVKDGCHLTVLFMGIFAVINQTGAGLQKHLDISNHVRRFRRETV